MRKRTLFTLVAVVLILGLPAASYPSDWRQVEPFIQGERDYIDRESIERKGSVITFLTRNLDRKGEATETRFLMNCENGTGTIKDILIYGPDETISRSYSFKEEKLQWGRITPGSCMERFRRLLCGEEE